MRNIQRPAEYKDADDVFLPFYYKSDLEQLTQKWNDRFMKHGQRLHLNPTETEI